VDETLVALVRANLHEVFGEGDAEARLATARRIYADDVTFVDDEETVVGIDALLAKAAALLDGLPPGASFGEDGPLYAGAGHAALGWRVGPPGGEAVVRGVDVVTVVDGRITELLTLLAG
jgi:hypothetical protein